MPSEIVVDSIDIELGILEAVPFDATERASGFRAYPYPILRLTDRVATAQFQVFILENDFLKATIAPELGGRILYIRDKRAGIDVLPVRPTLMPSPGGNRGAWLPDGVQIEVGDIPRLGGTGPVEALPQDPINEEDDARLVLHELIPGAGLSWHAVISMSADRPEITVEVRALNRLFASRAARQGVTFPFADGSIRSLSSSLTAVYSAERDAGFICRHDPGTFDGAIDLGPARSLVRGPFLLRPRQVDSWKVTLQVVSGVGRIDAAGPDACFGVSDGRLALQAAVRLRGRIFLLSKTGQTLEAAVDLEPERLLALPLEGNVASPEAVVFRAGDEAKEIAWTAEEPPLDLPEAEAATLEVGENLERLDEMSLRIALREPRTRPAAYVVLAMRAVRGERSVEAATLLDDALLTNSEDHLAWWLKAVLARLSGTANEERGDLLNAHFLAPLEPALRAESFLSIDGPLGKEPTQILSPLAGHPDALSEAACLLLDAGLRAEATRFLDEALLHGEVPILCYLRAFNLLEGSRMDVEAAQSVRRAATLPIGPPYPWRTQERQAIRVLSEKFPSDSTLQSWRALLDASESGV